MTTTTRPKIDFLNSNWDEVAGHLKDGKTPREIADLLAESLPSVMGVWKHLRDTGEAEARNFTPPPALTPPPRTTPSSTVRPRPAEAPRHTPDPALAQRIAGSTDLLVKAAGIDDKRIQAALGRARKAMVDLAGLIETYEGKAAARSRIARLEAELRIAKAELAGPGSATAHGGETGRGGYTRKPEEPVECRKGCGRMCSTAAGRVSHERNCTGNAA